MKRYILLATLFLCGISTYAQFVNAELSTQGEVYIANKDVSGNLIYLGVGYFQTSLSKASPTNNQVLWERRCVDSVVGLSIQTYKKDIYTLASVHHIPFNYMMVTRMDSAGNVKWSKKLSAGTNVSGGSFLVTKDHRLYIGSTTCGITNFIISMDSMGNFLWANSYQQNISSNGFIDGLVEDSAGRVLALSTSILYGTNNNILYYMFRVDTTGNVTWNNKMTQIFINVAQRVGTDRMRIDTAGNVFFNTNISDNTSMFGSIFKYDKLGKLRWANYYPAASTPNPSHNLCAFDIDSSRNIFTTGYFVTQTTQFRNLFTRIDADSGKVEASFASSQSISVPYFYKSILYEAPGRIVLGGSRNSGCLAAIDSTVSTHCQSGTYSVSAQPLPTDTVDYVLSKTPVVFTITDKDPTFMPLNSNRTLYCQTTGMEKESENEFTVFPNPATDKVTIRMKQGASSTIRVFSIDGKLLLEKSISPETGSMDVSTLATGIYFLKAGTYTVKLIRN